MKYAIGLDNGITGTIGIITNNTSIFVKTPIIEQYDYTKRVQKIHRLDCEDVIEILKKYVLEPDQAHCIVERPFVNPRMFNATLSAVRCCEATLIILESLKIPYSFIDSKEWQKILLPKAVKKGETKKASLLVGKRLFPQHSDFINEHKDADGILIAEYCRRKFNTLI